MNVRNKRLLIIGCISFFSAALLQLHVLWNNTLIFRVMKNDIPIDFFTTTVIKILAHAFFIAVFPSVLATLNKPLPSYIFLYMACAIYITIVTGINVVGIFFAILLLAVVVFYGVLKARELIGYFK